MTSKLYYDTARTSAFSTAEKLRAAASWKDKKFVRTWLEKQDSYTLHRQVRKRFSRNPYSVTDGRVAMRSGGRAIPRQI